MELRIDENKDRHISAIQMRVDSPLGGCVSPSDVRQQAVQPYRTQPKSGPRMFVLGQSSERHEEIIHNEFSDQLEILKDKIKKLEGENSFLKEKLRQYACRAEKNVYHTANATNREGKPEPYSRVVAARINAETLRIDESDAPDATRTATSTEDLSGALVITGSLIALGLSVFGTSS